MSQKYMTLTDLFKAICDAIRKCDGTTNGIKHEDIPERILKLPTSLKFSSAKYLFATSDRVEQMDELLKYSSKFSNLNYACSNNTVNEFNLGEILTVLLPRLTAKSGTMQNLFAYSSVNCDDLGDQLKGYTNLTGLLQKATITGNKPITFPDLLSCQKIDYLLEAAKGSFDVVLTNASKLTSASYAFSGTNVVTIKGNNTVIKGNIQRICYNCAQLQKFEANIVPSSLTNAFTGCVSLIELPGLDLSNITSDSNMNGGFETCVKVTATHFSGTVGKSSINVKMTLKLPPNLSTTSVEEVFIAFKTVVGTKAENMRTLAVKSDIYNLLTAEQIKIATDKGYKVASY